MDEARQQIEHLTGLKRPEKRGFIILLNKVEKVEGDLAEVKDNLAKVQDAVATQGAAQAQILKLVNQIHEKLDTNKIEEKAAQMDLLSKAAKKKSVWYAVAAIAAAFVLSGVAIAYFVEHSRDVAEITQSLHQKG
ncbi:MAG: hypothetical protein IKV10_00235 [Alphaproteobacteria bacterium]|nr:hypothetical protein [Alphaproteobacteria bacterium]